MGVEKVIVQCSAGRSCKSYARKKSHRREDTQMRGAVGRKGGQTRNKGFIVLFILFMASTCGNGKQPWRGDRVMIEKKGAGADRSV